MTKEIQAVLALILVVPTILYKLLVVTILWGWFVVPLGIREIGMWEAFALSMLVVLMSYSKACKEKFEGPFWDLAVHLCITSFALLLGAALHYWVL